MEFVIEFPLLLKMHEPEVAQLNKTAGQTATFWKKHQKKCYKKIGIDVYRKEINSL